MTTAQLRRFGVGRGGIRHRVCLGRLHQLHRGVYLLGTGRLTRRARWRAAVLACGPGALLSHLSAAALWGLLDDPRELVDVTVKAGRSRRGIHVHRSPDLTDADRALRHGIPVTAVARTLVDIAGVVSLPALGRAVREAERLGFLDVSATLALCSSGRKGSGRLRGILERDFGPVLAARSELEVRFVDLCGRQHLPMPAINVWVEGLLVDAVWIKEKVIIELDGFEFHRTRSAQRRDAERDRRLTLAGYVVLRFGWHDVVERPAATARAIRELLAGRAR